MTNDPKAGLKEAHNQLLDQLVSAHGEKTAMKVLAQMSGYEEMPPTIQEFINDDHYLGSVLRETIYPVWRNALYEIFPNPFYSPYLEVIVTGAIGTGKSTVSLAGSLYDLCKIAHLKEPQEYYRLVKSTKIALALMNATMDLAGGVLYDQLITWMQESPFFRRLLNSSSGATLLPKNIHVVIGSRFSHILGMAVVGAILSEINFQTKAAEQAYDNFTNAKRRIQSRFLTRGSYPGRMWLDSSKADCASFLDTHVKESLNDPLVKVYDNPIWVVKDHTGIYSGKKFKVFIGDDKRDPFLLERPDQIIGLDDSKIIDVPVEYQNDFRLDIHNSLRDLAGVSTYTSFKFISSVEILDRAFSGTNPVHKEIITLDFYDPNDAIIRYVKWEELEKSSHPRFMHIDLGLKHDKTGIAISHLVGLQTVSRDDPFTGKSVKVTEPVFKTDLVLAIEARSGQEVPIYKIKEFILTLVNRDYPLVLVTMDGYQSSNLRQDLQLQGVDTDYLSLDRNKQGYIALKNAIMENRYHGPHNELLIKELRDLVDVGSKLDHPADGSKDLADAVAGSVFSSFINMDKYSLLSRADDYLAAFENLSDSPESFYERLLGSKNSIVINHL